MINSVSAESRERRLSRHERRFLHRLQDGIHTAPSELVEQTGGTMEIYFDAIGVFVDPVDDHCVAVVRSLWQPGA